MPCGWRGVRPIKRFLLTWAMVVARHGSICVTKHRQAMGGRTIMGHSTGRISRQSSSTHREESLFQTEEFYSFDISRHRHRCKGTQLLASIQVAMTGAVICTV